MRVTELIFVSDIQTTSLGVGAFRTEKGEGQFSSKKPPLGKLTKDIGSANKEIMKSFRLYDIGWCRLQRFLLSLLLPLPHLLSHPPKLLLIFRNLQFRDRVFPALG